METLFLLGQVAQMLNIRPHRISYLLSSGQVKEPLRIGGRRMFTINNIQQIAGKLGVQFRGKADRAK